MISSIQSYVGGFNGLITSVLSGYIGASTSLSYQCRAEAAMQHQEWLWYAPFAHTSAESQSECKGEWNILFRLYLLCSTWKHSSGWRAPDLAEKEWKSALSAKVSSWWILSFIYDVLWWDYEGFVRDRWVNCLFPRSKFKWGMVNLFSHVFFFVKSAGQ